MAAFMNAGNVCATLLHDKPRPRIPKIASSRPQKHSLFKVHKDEGAPTLTAQWLPRGGGSRSALSLREEAKIHLSVLSRCSAGSLSTFAKRKGLGNSKPVGPMPIEFWVEILLQEVRKIFYTCSVRNPE